MNFFINRPLLSISFTYIAALSLSSYLSGKMRAVMLAVLLPLIIISLITYIIVTVTSKRPPRKINGLFVSCTVFAAIGLIIPFILFNINNSGLEKYAGTTCNIKGIVNEITSASSSYTAFSADITEIDGNKVNCRASMFLTFTPTLEDGDIFVCDAELTLASDNFGYSSVYLKRNNLYYEGECKTPDHFTLTGHRRSLLDFVTDLRSEAGFAFSRIFSKDTAALAKALILGDKNDMTAIWKRNFVRIGVSHLFSLSGMHLALFTAMIMSVAKYFIFNRNLRYIIYALLAVFIMIFTGASASIARAALMVVYYQIANLIKVQHDLLTTLFAVIFGILLFEPYMILDVGLVLSFVATFGIALLLPSIRNISLFFFKNPTKLNPIQKILKFVLESVSITFAAGMFINIAVIYLFDSMSLITILSTLLYTPLIIAFIVVAAFAFVLKNIPIISSICLACAERLCSIIINSASSLSKIRTIAVATDYTLLYSFTIVFIIGFAYIVSKNKSAKVLIIFTLATQTVFFSALLAQIHIESKTASLYYISDSKGECLFITDGKETSIIDNSYCYSDYNNLIQQAVNEKHGIEIDKIILTHYHKNHRNLLRRLSESYIIREIYMPTPTYETDASFALDLEEACENYGVKFIYYNPFEEIIISGGLKYTAFPYERKSKTGHPKTAALLESEKYTAMFSAGYDDKCKSYDSYKAALENTDFAVIATHGYSTDKLPENIPLLIPEQLTNGTNNAIWLFDFAS